MPKAPRPSTPKAPLRACHGGPDGTSAKDDASVSGFAGQALRCLLLRVLGVTGGLIVSVVLARVLGPAEFGIYAFVMALIAVLAMPVLVGLPVLLVRETAAGMVHGDSARLARLVGWSVKVILTGAALAIAAMLALGKIAPGPAATPQFAALLVALPLLPILALGQARAAVLRGLGRVAEGLIPETLVRPVVMVAILGGLAVFGGAITAKQALICACLAGLAAFAVGAGLLARAWPRTGAGPHPHPEADTRVWLSAILPLSMAGGLQTLNANIDMAAMGLMRSAAETGQYRIAVTGASLGLFVLATLRIVVQPRIARLHTRGNHAQLQHLVSATALASVIAAALALGGIVLFGAPLIGALFGPVYQEALPPLTLLLFGNLALSAIAMSTPLLTMSGGEREVLTGLALAVGLNVALNVWLIPAHGAMGAAAATVIAALVGQGVTYRRAWLRLGVDASPLAAMARGADLAALWLNRRKLHSKGSV